MSARPLSKSRVHAARSSSLHPSLHAVKNSPRRSRPAAAGLLPSSMRDATDLHTFFASIARVPSPAAGSLYMRRTYWVTGSGVGGSSVAIADLTPASSTASRAIPLACAVTTSISSTCAAYVSSMPRHLPPRFGSRNAGPSASAAWISTFDACVFSIKSSSSTPTVASASSPSAPASAPASSSSTISASRSGPAYACGADRSLAHIGSSRGSIFVTSRCDPACAKDVICFRPSSPRGTPSFTARLMASAGVPGGPSASSPGAGPGGGLEPASISVVVLRRLGVGVAVGSRSFSSSEASASASSTVPSGSRILSGSPPGGWKSRRVLLVSTRLTA